jgi:ubiquinone/menaquinone biosynthesis C-methylase UbiE
MSNAAFDKIAERYDTMWTTTAIGRVQRQAVWRWVDPLFVPGDRILDLGCGTGADALHFVESGISVHGIDGSGEMVRLARMKGVEAEQVAFENLDQLGGGYDGAFSNFGALNCLERLDGVAANLARLIRFRGLLAICLMGPFCLWETFHYLRRGNLRAARRRFARQNISPSLGVRVHYPSVHTITAAFKAFRLLSWYGIGLFVPPSYVEGLPARGVERMANIDHCLAHVPGLRMLCDHRLLIFERL